MARQVMITTKLQRQIVPLLLGNADAATTTARETHWAHPNTSRLGLQCEAPNVEFQRRTRIFLPAQENFTQNG